MGIAQKVARNFSDAVRSRGQSYFSKGRVSLISAKPNEVVAKVRGTTKYRVRVRLRGAKLLASCTCPYFSPQGEPCKHLWATLLLADSRGFLQTAPSFAVRFVPELPRTSTQQVTYQARARSQVPSMNHSQSMDLGMNMGGESACLALAPVHPGREIPRIAPPAVEALSVSRAARKGPGLLQDRPRDRSRGIGGSSAAVGPGPFRGRPPRGPSRSTAMPSGSWSTFWTLRPPKATTKWSSTWRGVSVSPPVSGGPCVPGGTPPARRSVKYDPEDRLLLALLDEAHHGTWANGASTGGSAGNGTAPTTSSTASPGRAAGDLRGIRRFVLRKDQAGLVERLAKSGRLRLRRTEGEDDPPTMRWDDGQPWRFCLEIRTEAGGKRWALARRPARGDNRMDLAEPLVLSPGLLVLGVGRTAAVRRLGRHVVDPPASLREGDHLRRAPAGLDAGPDLAETRVPPWSSSSRSASRRLLPGPAPA